jgi:aminocyclitol acetyltransferase
MMNGEWNTALGEREDRVQSGILIGRYSYFPWSVETLELFVRSIGRFTSINETAYIHRNHPTNMVSTSMGIFDVLQGSGRVRYEKQYVKNAHGRNLGHKVAIGNDVWIGANVFICASTVKAIGDGAVLGAGAIVTKDVPPYAIVVGVNEIKRYRFTPEEIEILLKLRWWEWSSEQICENCRLLMEPQLLFEKYSDINE